VLHRSAPAGSRVLPVRFLPNTDDEKVSLTKCSLIHPVYPKKSCRERFHHFAPPEKGIDDEVHGHSTLRASKKRPIWRRAWGGLCSGSVCFHVRTLTRFTPPLSLLFIPLLLTPDSILHSSCIILHSSLLPSHPAPRGTYYAMASDRFRGRPATDG